ncbi:MAG: hypothetical protein AAF317_20500, partial [Pseudomonadota bacterium]
VTQGFDAELIKHRHKGIGHVALSTSAANTDPTEIQTGIVREHFYQNAERGDLLESTNSSLNRFDPRPIPVAA